MSQEHGELKASLATCIDSRFQDLIDEWKEQKGLTKGNHDRIAIAGAAGDLDLVYSQIALSIKLHKTREVHVINHQDCGYYREVLNVNSGVPEEHDKHTEGLKALKEKVLNEFPTVQFFGYYATLDQEGTAKAIEPVEI